jgi:hypothetical protein
MRELIVAVAPEDANAVAEQWREMGRGEHASIAVFARLSLDLLALGAPSRLLRQAQRAGLDEVAHADLCFSLARAVDGREVGPAPFRAASSAGQCSRFRWLALSQLAVGSLIEGVMFEGYAAALAGKLAAACEEPALARILSTIAEDEGRHAAHAWDVLEWCIAEGGFAVTCVVRGALRKLPERVRSTLPPVARGGAWVRYGIPSRALETDAYAEVRRLVVRRARTLISNVHPTGQVVAA